MLKQVFLGRFEHVVTRFGPWKIPKGLDKGPFCHETWVKTGSQKFLSKSDCGPHRMRKQVKLAHFEPVLIQSNPWPYPSHLGFGRGT